MLSVFQFRPFGLGRARTGVKNLMRPTLFNWGMENRNSHLMKQTLRVWQPRYEEELTQEEGKETMVNMTSFFDVLVEWDHALTLSDPRQKDAQKITQH